MGSFSHNAYGSKNSGIGTVDKLKRFVQDRWSNLVGGGGSPKPLSKMRGIAQAVQDSQDTSSVAGKTTAATEDSNSLKFRESSNLSTVCWGGKLLALSEQGFPHFLDPKSLNTIKNGRDDEVLQEAFDLTENVRCRYRIDQKLNRLVLFGFRGAKEVPVPSTNEEKNSGGQAGLFPESSSGISNGLFLPILQVVEFDRNWGIRAKCTVNIRGLSYV